MKKYLISLLLFILPLTLHASKTLNPHVHGEVSFDMAADGKEVLVMMAGPSESFYGFEHKPKTRNEKAKFKEVNDLWKKETEKLIVLPKALGCKFHKRFFKTQRQASSKGHSDIKAEIHYKCEKLVKDSQIKIMLVKHFPKIKKLHVQLIRANGSVYDKNHKEKVFELKL